LHLAAAICLIGGGAMADEVGRSCRTSSNLVGACFKLHGRLFVAAGTPSTRIAGTGTDRIFGVWDRQAQPESDEVVPAAVRTLLTSNPFSTDVYGDYEVCPFEKSTIGSMRAVCIESAANLVARRR
jgi:hypothetical protein